MAHTKPPWVVKAWERRQLACRLRFTGEPLTLKQIAQRLGISTPERVRQMLAQALRKKEWILTAEQAPRAGARQRAALGFEKRIDDTLETKQGASDRACRLVASLEPFVNRRFVFLPPSREIKDPFAIPSAVAQRKKKEPRTMTSQTPSMTSPTSSTQSTPALHTSREVAKILNVSLATIRRLMTRGQLKKIYIGDSVRVTDESLQAILRSGTGPSSSKRGPRAEESAASPEATA